MTPLDTVLGRLDGVRAAGKDQWYARCPCRDDDRSPSLSVGVGAEGRVLLKCHRGDGCDLDGICRAIGMDETALFPEEARRDREPAPSPGKREFVEAYPYHDADGVLVMEVVRFVQDGRKTFSQRRPDPSQSKGWSWSTTGVDKPLYRLPQVLAAVAAGRPVIICEGEKDVHAAESLGFVATCNPGGASRPGDTKWTAAHTAALAACRKVLVVADNDTPGLVHARNVEAQLLAAGCQNVRVKVPPDGIKDLHDLIAAGLTLKDLTEPPVPTEEVPPSQGELVGDLGAGLPEEATSGALDAAAESIQALVRRLEALADDPALTEERRLVRARRALTEAFSDPSQRTAPSGRTVAWQEFLAETAGDEFDWLIPGLLERTDRVIVVAGEGVGKALTLSERIATPGGWTTMGELRPGDLVLGMDGKPTRVTGISPVLATPESYVVRFSDGAEIKACADHQWYTETLVERHERRPGGVRTTAEIRATLSSRRASAAVNHAVPCAEPLDLPHADLPVPPYALGYWLGNGTSRAGEIAVHGDDVDHVASRIAAEGFEVGTSRPASGNCAGLTVHGLGTLLRSAGVLGDKHVPPAYLRASLAQRTAFLQGLMDSGGCSDGRPGLGGSRGSAVCEYTSACRALAEGVRELVLTLGCNPSPVSDERGLLEGRDIGPKHRFTFQSWDAPFSTPRKLSRWFPPRTPRARYRYIVAVEPCEPEPMRCIAVDNASRTYLAGPDMVPTHNSVLARQVALMSAAGIHPFTTQPMDPIRTLYVDLENPERVIRRKARFIDRMLRDSFDASYDDRAVLYTRPGGINVLRPDHQDDLMEVVEKARPDLICLGPLYKAFVDPGGRTSEAVTTEVAMFLDQIRSMFNVALWLEHHAPLGQGGSRDLRPFGSSVWSRWSEFGVSLVPDPTASEPTYELRHYRGARDERKWPLRLKRGTNVPFEVVEFSPGGWDAERLDALGDRTHHDDEF